MADPMPATAPGTDVGLVLRIAQGEDGALAELYDRWGGLVLASALRVTRDRNDAEEVVIDVFAQAWRTAARFEPGRGSVPAWLTTIARTRALDLVRARGRRARIEDVAGTGEGLPPTMGQEPPSPDQPLVASERQQAVAAALAELPPPQREAIELAFFRGLSQSEIAHQLGEPLGTVKTRVRLAMGKLRDRLRPYHFAEPVR